jgi:peptidoglycan-N-acetylglucosamine deacetylase
LSWLDIHKELCMWGSYFRPPEGKYDDGVIQYLNSALWDVKLVMWDIDGFDWTLKTADEICAVVDEQIGDGGIILLHDGDSTTPNGDRWATVEATDRLITKYKTQGFEFVPLSEMELPGNPRKVSL